MFALSIISTLPIAFKVLRFFLYSLSIYIYNNIIMEKFGMEMGVSRDPSGRVNDQKKKNPEGFPLLFYFDSFKYSSSASATPQSLHISV
jgi:hypothetical protein